MKYSEKLGEISDEQFQTALTKSNLGTFIKAEAIPYGNFKQNVFLNTNRGEYVFRGNPHFPGQFEQEQFSITLLKEKTKVPVPWPFIVDESTNIFGWSYVLMPKLPGIQIEDEGIQKTITPKDWSQLAIAYAKNLAEMHSLTWPTCGKYDEKTKNIKEFQKPYGEWVIEQINNLLNASREINNRTTDDDIEWVHSIVENGHEALLIPFTPCYVMQDYQWSNMLVDKVNGVWKVTGVFDLVEGYFGDGETDLSRMYKKLLEQNNELGDLFIKSYTTHHSFRSGFEKRFPIYIILDCLIVWKFVQKYNKNWIERDVSFREWCEKWTKLENFK